MEWLVVIVNDKAGKPTTKTRRRWDRGVGKKREGWPARGGTDNREERQRKDDGDIKTTHTVLRAFNGSWVRPPPPVDVNMKL